MRRHDGFCGVVLAAALLAPAAAGELSPPRPVASFLERHCAACHSGKAAEAGFDLAALALEADSPTGDRRWTTLIDRVAHGEMPPADADQPKPADRARFVTAAGGWLADAIRDRDTRLGRVDGRRLTRRETERSLHALLGIDIPLAQELPEEPRPGGFTTVAERQSLSHHQLQRHLAVVDLALDEAFRRTLSPAGELQKDLDATGIVRTNPASRCREPELLDGRAVVWSGGPIYYGRLPCTTAPADGWYRFRVTASGLKLPATGGVWCTVHTGLCVSSAPLLQYITAFEAVEEPREIAFECWLPKGHMLEIRPGDITLKRANFREGQVGAGEGEPQNVPGLALERLVMERFHQGPGDDALRRLVFGDMPLEKDEQDKKTGRLRPRPENAKADAARLVAAFARRAFRRPVPDEVVAGYVTLVHDLLEEKTPFAEALRAGYRAILCSSRFLYLAEEPGPLDDHALACRLSYFLTGAPPDELLSTLADEGTLRDPAVLRREADRLLAGDGTRRFVEDFAAEWLDLDQIDFTEPDRKLYPEFDAIVQAGMLAETRATLAEALAENRPITWLIAADTTWLDSRLARFYKLPDVTGDALRRITVAPASHRGGLLAHGAILKVTANGNNTSPVIRGVWIGERLLGDEIRPPPDGIPAIEPDIRGTTTIRAQLAKHRSDASCASCHKTIDPPGFALENFDPAGQWRDHYLAFDKGKRKKGAEVDASDTLPDGRRFKDFAEFRALVAADPDRLARSLAGHLLVYGTGAELSYADREAVGTIAKAAAKQDHGVKSILLEVITSPTFTSK
jgi:mono/diheme cytochrome c family protein